jgi:HSP20 family protein
MAEAATKLPVKNDAGETGKRAKLQPWHPFERLRQDMDRLFDAFEGGFASPFFRSSFDVDPFWRRDTWVVAPAVNVTESDKAYEVTAELPGMDEKSIEVNLANGGLTIKGEKQEQREEKEKDYHVQERHFGSFERFFQVPAGVDSDKVTATFKNGVLTVTLPKTAEAQKAATKIAIKAA